MQPQAIPIEPQELDQWEQSRTVSLALLEKDPNHLPALHFMGKYAMRAGQLDAALGYFGQAHALAPGSASIATGYALVLLLLHRIPAGVALLRQLVATQKDCGDLLYLLANTLKDFGHDTRCEDDLVEAIGYYQRLVQLQPNHANAYNNCGVTSLDLGRLAEAETCFRRAAELTPQAPEPPNNLSIVSRLQGLPGKSVAFCRKALALRPEYPEAFNNLGNALKDLDDLPGAREAYERAIALNPKPDFRCNLAMVLLALGLFKEGWETYEWRKTSYELRFSQPHLTAPQWTGQEAVGKTLYIHGEQGFGDIIQFCRYASMAADRGLHVILDAPPPLARLLQTVRGVDQIPEPGQPLPPFDFHCPIMSLPLAFKTELATIPAAPAYLAATEEDIRRWRQRMQEARITGFKVGLVWAGSSREHSADLRFTDQQRSMAPTYLAPLMDLAGVQYCNLQKGSPAPEWFPMIDWMDDCKDFADTAAYIMNLDLVITVDTAVAHLAGALGRPVWVLNRFAGCWRWLRGRDDSPWYPSLRLFTQTAAGDWPDVIVRVRRALQELLR